MYKKYFLLTIIFSMCFVVLSPVIAKAAIVKEKTIYCSRDAYVQQGLPDENYGAASVFIIGCNDDDCYETYLYFNLSSIKSLNVNKIELKIPIYSSPEGIVANVYSTSTYWTESSITWNNKPSASNSLGEVTIGKHDSSITSHYNLDITSEAIGGDSISLCLESPTATSYALGDAKDDDSTGVTLKVSYEEGSSINDQIGLESVLAIIFIFSMLSAAAIVAVVIVKRGNKSEERKIRKGNKKIMGLERVKRSGAGKQKEKNNIEKIKLMMSVSTRINLDRMQDVLDMNKKEFNNKIFEWARDFGFTIDSNDLIVNKDTVSEFIDMLDEQFNEWTEKEKHDSNKI